MTRTTTKQAETVELARDTLVVAYKRAESLGMSFSEYVQSLITKDAEAEVKDPWRQPVPKEVDERWERDLAETEAAEKINPRPGARTADELIQQLDEEAARLPEYEGN